jgi:hypothetical protein
MNFSSDPYIAENQMRAIIQHLVAFAYIDADFDPAERRFIEDHIATLVEQRARSVLGDRPLSPDILEKWTRHFHEVMQEIDHGIQGYFQESVAHGETKEQFVLSRLKLGCFELLSRFDEEGQRAILSAVEELMQADGVVHPNEVAFRDEIVKLINAAEEVAEAELQPIEEGEVIIGDTQHPRAAMANHPFLSQHEWDFSRDRETFERQSAFDMKLVAQVMETLGRQRAAGAGRLAEAPLLSGRGPSVRFLDGYVWVHSPSPERDCELLVLGDLHGCYSCLKAALLQVDFFAKAQAHADNPDKNPPIYLVFLGDYIDRGKFSLSGTLRTAMQLYLKMPEHVFPLRGNHEYYVELDGKVLAPVRPCEAMDSIAAVAKNEIFATYMRLFETLPYMLAFGDLLFVHGGIPRADTLKERFKDLSSLNDDELRFQMMWSDPSIVDVVPLDLQQASARFPFGRRQFLQFMSRVGSRVMIRGHEMVKEGFRTAYDEPEAKLLTLFSAGGADNDDLTPDSHYRDVTPMALTIRQRAGVNTITPFEIDYRRYNNPEFNAFFKRALGG